MVSNLETYEETYPPEVVVPASIELFNRIAAIPERAQRVTESWQSPDGVPLHIAAAWPRWPWSDLADALQPNGRLGLDTYASPVGVEIQAYVNALYALANTAGFVAPLGADPGADLTAWKNRLNQGEPYGADVRAILEQIHAYHGVLGLPIDKGITPLLIQSGWTDDLFPVGQGLRIYDLLRQKSKTAPVALQLGDLGHSRAANHPADLAAFNAQGLAFFEARLKHAGSGPAPGQRDRLRPDVPEDRHPRRRPLPRIVLRRARPRGDRLPPQGRPARDLQRRRRRALTEALATGRRPVQRRHAQHRHQLRLVLAGIAG